MKWHNWWMTFIVDNQSFKLKKKIVNEKVLQL